jgi:subtilase family serine protease
MEVSMRVRFVLPLAFVTALSATTIAQQGHQGPNADPTFRVKVGGAHPLATTSPTGLSPTTIQTAYSLPAAGGSGVIAIVDAFDDPTAENDLNVFSSQYGLPACTTANGCFKKINAHPGRFRFDQGWALEASLDVQWAHALAPQATIWLVQSRTNSFADLFAAVDYASSHGANVVSMSWGSREFSSESSYDYHFAVPGVVFVASAGDTGGVTGYPAVSPNVVGVGGTTLNFDSNGNLSSETAWSGSGGGRSAYEARPSFQDGISGVVGSKRGSPDVSWVGDPNSGVSVYDSAGYLGQAGWFVLGGTSVGSPSWAAVINAAASNTAENPLIYSGLGGPNFRDITSGTAGSFSATAGWDFVTGVGSPLTLAGK